MIMLCCGIRGTRVALHFGSGVGYGPCGAVGQRKVESSGFRRETEKDGSLDTATVLSSGASLERPEVWRSERKRRASIFRFRSAHRGKSFGIATDAEMTDVLPGV